jgi:hypothetical protein
VAPHVLSRPAPSSSNPSLPHGRRLAAGPLGAGSLGGVLLAALYVARCLQHGSEPLELAGALTFLALYVLAPGLLAVRALGLARADRLEHLALGAALGLALEVLAFVGSRALGLPGLFIAWPLALAPLALAARRRNAQEPAAPLPDLGPLATHLLVALCALTMLRTPLTWSSGWWRDLDGDFAFHAGNAASLWRGLSFEDARVAGLAANYHVFAYALAAGAKDVFGVPVAESLGRALAGALPLALVALVFAAARAWTRSARAGLVAAALLVLHANPRTSLAPYFGGWVRALDANGTLDHGVFRSPSMALGFVLCAGLALLLARVLEAARLAPRIALALALLVFVASGTKGSLLPVLVPGAGLVLFAARVRRAPWSLPLALFGLFVLAGAPLTLRLAAGEASYAGAMFRFGPLQAWEASPAFAALCARLDAAPAAAPRAVLYASAPLWLALALGPAGWLALAWLVRHRRAPGAFALFWLGVLLAGLALAGSLRAMGLSELFFLYPGQLGLALLAGAHVAELGARAARSTLVWFAGLALALPAAGAIAQDLSRARAGPPEESGLLAEYRAGLAWLAAHAERDAVVASTSAEPLVSVLGERTAFYETERSTPHFLAHWWTRVDGVWRYAKEIPLAYPDRATLIEALRGTPRPGVLTELRARVAAGRTLYVLEERLRLVKSKPMARFELAPVGPRRFGPEYGVPVFENEALRVYAPR